MIVVIMTAYMLGLFQQFFLDNSKDTVHNEKIYIRKNFMTQTELVFYNKIKELESNYRIIPQLNLATVIKKVNKGYYSELFRNIDFAIFDKEYKTLLLLIELNDNTHNYSNRKNRDLKVKDICNNAGIKLITFYTNCPNEKNYVLKRINDELNNVNNK